MSQASKTTAKTYPLAQGTAKDIHAADGWQDITLIHTADTDGELRVGFDTGEVSESASVILPRNVSVGPIRISPETRVRAVSLSGSRKVSVIVSPLPPGMSGIRPKEVC